MTAVQQIGANVAAFTPADLPKDVVEVTKLLLLDSLACALAGTGEPAAKACADTFSMLGDAPVCTIVGTNQKASVVNATLGNAALIRCLDFDGGVAGDNSGAGSGHPGILWAIALTVGEYADCSGLEVLAAGAIGYEVKCRGGDMVNSTVVGPWDYSVVTGLAAPAMAGKLLHLSPESLAGAIALGAAHCNTLGIVRGYGALSMAKDIADPLNAQFGVLAALLARNGATGPVHVIEDGTSGWVRTIATRPDTGALTAPFGGNWRLVDASMKAFPCVGPAQTPVAAALQARALLGDDVRRIAHVDILLPDHPNIRAHVSNPERLNPQTRETADHSLPYLVAAALVDGEITVAQFHRDRWLDPDIKEMMGKLSFLPDKRLNGPEFDRNACIVEVTTAQGRIERVELPKPRSVPTREVVARKFRQCARDLMTGAQIDAVIDTIEHLDSLPSIRPLLTMLAVKAEVH